MTFTGRGMEMETSKLYYRVDRRRISLLRFVFEAYEGVAVVTTLDSASGLIRLAIAPGCEAVALAVMDDLSQSIMIEPVASTTARKAGGLEFRP